MSPSLAAAGSGFLLSWIEPAAGGNAVRYARFEQDRWREPRTVASGSDILANWARSPAIAQASGGWLLAAWVAKSPGRSGQVIELGHTERSGPWRRLGTVSGGGKTDQDFPFLIPEGDRFRAFWLAAGTLHSALVASRFGRDELLDSRVCECCSLSAAITSEGPIVVYRDRSEQEVRDIAIVRRASNGWTGPAAVAAEGWRINACPINGPAVAADGRSVAVAWLTAAQQRSRVEAAFSGDSGATFGKPIVVDDASPLGRVSVILDGSDAIVAWLAGGHSASIRLRRVRPAGPPGEPVTVARTTAGQSSGFPTLARSGDTLMVAWVEAAQATRVRAATIPAAAVP